MTWIEGIGWIAFWSLMALGYTRLARYFNIVDLPNHRSSHEHVTIRGGGIIFWLGLMFATVLFDNMPIEFAVAAGILGVTSFVDDLVSIQTRVRILLQLSALAALFLFNIHFQELLQWPWFIAVLICITMMGFVNIYNFMDGINGLSVSYTLLGLFSLSVVDDDTYAYYFISLPLVVMAVFNVRPKGKAIFFSGDIGSITAGLTLGYFVFVLCIRETTFIYLSLLMVYMIDGGWTIIIRFCKREQVWEAHRSHLYQLLANELGWGHIKVVTVYIAVQLAINLLTYLELELMFIDSVVWFLAMFLIVTTGYFIARHYVNLTLVNQGSQNNYD